MSIESLELEIEVIDAKLHAMKSRRRVIQEKLDTENSKLFISENRITPDQVQGCDGIPWMGHVDKFGLWLKENSTKQWCCWNGLIYKTQEIIEGRMDRDAVGRYKDLSA